MIEILLASDNAGKIKEINALLNDLPLTIIPQAQKNIPAAIESGLTFVENAILKARQGAQYSHLPCIGEDSGLCVDALKSAPGIYSARYAGVGAPSSAYIEKLLKALEDVPYEKRRAHYYCTVAFMQHSEDPVPFIYQARWDGVILEEPKGIKGFGYDPIFFIPELNCTAAELSLDQKNACSHRAQALKALKAQLKICYSI